MAAMLLSLFAVQELDRVHVDEATGEITLAARNTVLREHSDPSKYDVVTDMAVCRGRLFASACMAFGDASLYEPSAYSGSAEIFEYAPSKDEWKAVREIQQSMLFNLRVIDDRLLAPEYFPWGDHWKHIHTFDGDAWAKMGPMPGDIWHVMDVIKIGSTLYASGSARDPERGDPDWIKGHGHVWTSADGGRTWTDIRRTADLGRVLDMVEFQGKLYANERGYQLIAWDGKRWEEIPVRFDGQKVDAKLGSAHLLVFAGKIVAINADLTYTYDGKKWTSTQPGYIDLWRDGAKLYGLREDGHVSVTEDGAKWTRVTKDGVPAKEFDRQATKGRPIHRGALALHRGRFFVGTGAEGKIYAAALEEKGSCTAKPQKFEAGDRLALAWEAAAGAHVRVRTAETQEELAKASWKDAAPSIALPKRHKWAQVRVELEGDGRRTPVVRGLKLAKE